jgi:predicted ATPase
MMIKSVSCIGYRGFATKQSLNLATPNGKPGSGLTILVGPNGGGKSTLIECFNKIATRKDASFSTGKRNAKAGNRVEIDVDIDGHIGVLSTIKGGSQAEWKGGDVPKIYHLPSRRSFIPYFGMTNWSRATYLANLPSSQFRSSSLDNYTFRLLDLNKNGSAMFDRIMERIIGKPFVWSIDQDDSGQYFINISKQNGTHHNSDGMGEGIISLMFIVDALCGDEDEIIVIDEPELSLHPQLQIRLLDEILMRTKTSQIVISTHSPNLVSLESIANDGMIARVFESENGTKICEIDERSRKFILSTINNINNPHILGIDARSCFFAEDRLIITEGQEDVVLYPIIMNELGKVGSMPFFGYGAGGASNIIEVAHLLYNLGFQKIGAIYDGDKRDDFNRFNQEFSTCGYRAWIIPADDIRDKEEYKSEAKSGLLDKKRKHVKEEYKVELSSLFDEIETFLKV